ncbi:MAG: hypothetical protein H6510_01795 [Acidobacteria bacterium]|nr:hypothetical protein [Acidobacteriota bacterium]
MKINNFTRKQKFFGAIIVPVFGVFGLCIFVIQCRPGGRWENTHAAHFLALFYNMNSVNIYTKDSIVEKKIRVEWGSTSPLGVTPKKFITLFDGNKSNKPKQVYGWNLYRVYYDGKELRSFQYFNTNYWYGHSVNIYFKGEEVSPDVEVVVVGP